MKLHNQRYYFDFNATSPLSQKVISFLESGEFFFANPATTHTSGKQARRVINQTSQYLESHFNLNGTHRIFYHSGATEGVNTIVKGIALENKIKNGKPIFYVLSSVDHASSYDLIEELHFHGHQTFIFTVDKDGQFDLEKLINDINTKSNGQTILLNYTWVHNETGVVWPLTWAEEIKKRTGALVHVDAVQAPGKILNYNKLNTNLDAYTFSGHKFGSLRGVGFTFVRQDLVFKPLLRGGGQQSGDRSGTENPMGVHTLRLALESLDENQNFIDLENAQKLFEKKLENLCQNQGVIVGKKAKFRCANTTYFILNKTHADVVLAALDMSGIDISSGSACSSGSLKPSRVLLNMGFTIDQAKSAMRFSFSPFLKSEDVEEFWPVVDRVLNRFLT